MKVPGSTSATTLNPAEHLRSQYSLQTAHLGLKRIKHAATSLSENLIALKTAIHGGNNPPGGPASGAVRPETGIDSLMASIQAAESVLANIAANSDALDTNILQVFPQATERLDHENDEAGFALTRGNKDFPEQAKVLTTQVKNFALAHRIEAAAVLCVIEEAGPAVSNPYLVADHSILVQMNSLTHL
jgi:hypothetical protein